MKRKSDVFAGTSSLAAVDKAKQLLLDESSDSDIEGWMSRVKKGHQPPTKELDDDDSVDGGRGGGGGGGIDESMSVIGGDAAVPMSGKVLLAAATLLHPERHQEQINRSENAFVFCRLPDAPSLLADLFIDRSELCVALQHDLLVAWSRKTQQPVPPSVMEALHILSFRAPDIVLAQAASLSARSLYLGGYEGPAPSWRPCSASVLRALEFFGACDMLLGPLEEGKSCSGHDASCGSASGIAVFAETHRWVLITDWLRLLAAAYSHPPQTLTEASMSDALHMIRCLLLLGADQHVQECHRSALFDAINAILPHCCASPGVSEAMKRLFDSLVAILPSQLSTLSLAHACCYLGVGNSQTCSAAVYFSAAVLRRFEEGRMDPQIGFSLPYISSYKMPDDGSSSSSSSSSGRETNATPIPLGALQATLAAIFKEAKQDLKNDDSRASPARKPLSEFLEHMPGLYVLLVLTHCWSAAAAGGRDGWSGEQIKKVLYPIQSLKLLIECPELSRLGPGHCKDHVAHNVKDVLTLLDALLDHFLSARQVEGK